MVRLDNWQNTFKIGVIGYRRVQRKMCSEWIDFIDLSILHNEFKMFMWVSNDEIGFRMTKITLKTVI